MCDFYKVNEEFDENEYTNNNNNDDDRLGLSCCVSWLFVHVLILMVTFSFNSGPQTVYPYNDDGPYHTLQHVYGFYKL